MCCAVKKSKIRALICYLCFISVLSLYLFFCVSYTCAQARVRRCFCSAGSEVRSVEAYEEPILSEVPLLYEIVLYEKYPLFCKFKRKTERGDSLKNTNRDLISLEVTIIAALFGVIAVVIAIITLLFVIIDTLIKLRIKSTKDELDNLIKRIEELEKETSDRKNRANRPGEQDLFLRELIKVLQAEILKYLHSRDNRESTPFLPFN